MSRFTLILFIWSCIQLSMDVAGGTPVLDNNNSTLISNYTEILKKYKEIFRQLNFTKILNVTDIPTLFSIHNGSVPTNFSEILNFTHPSILSNYYNDSLPPSKILEILNITDLSILFNNYNGSLPLSNFLEKLNVTDIPTLLGKYNVSLLYNISTLLSKYNGSLPPNFFEKLETSIVKYKLMDKLQELYSDRNDINVTYIESERPTESTESTSNERSGYSSQREPRTLSILIILDLILAQIIANLQAQNAQPQNGQV